MTYSYDIGSFFFLTSFKKIRFLSLNYRQKLFDKKKICFAVQQFFLFLSYWLWLSVRGHLYDIKFVTFPDG